MSPHPKLLEWHVHRQEDTEAPLEHGCKSFAKLGGAPGACGPVWMQDPPTDFQRRLCSLAFPAHCSFSCCRLGMAGQGSWCLLSLHPQDLYWHGPPRGSCSLGHTGSQSFWAGLGRNMANAFMAIAQFPTLSKLLAPMKLSCLLP